MTPTLVFQVGLDSLKKKFYDEVEIKYLYIPMLLGRPRGYRFRGLVTRVTPNTPRQYPYSCGPDLDARVFVFPIPWVRSLWPVRFEFPVLGIWKLRGHSGAYLDGKIKYGRWFDFQPIFRTKEERFKPKWKKSTPTQ